MNKVKWADFKLSPMKYITEKETRVIRGDGSYFLVKYYSPYVQDSGYRLERSERTKERRNYRCDLCGSVKRVLWVVPFDGVVAPGHYCYKCRKSKNILDVNRAKKYNKII